MAGKNGRSPADLKKDLFKNPKAFSFFQAIRLLRRLTDYDDDDGYLDVKSYESLFHNIVRVRPQLSLSFPGTDLANVEEIAHGERTVFLLTATFLGLYGASSPLPTHYTEDLLDEASDDKTVTRDFLDIISNPFYRLFFQIWTRNRWFIKIAEEDLEVYYERLFCLLGMGAEEFRRNILKSRGLLRYIGLFSQFPRSSSGLAALLSDAVDVPDVQVIPNILRKVQIPVEQRCQVGVQGTTLGEDCYLGGEIEDRMGKIRISAGPLSDEKYHDLLPGRPLFLDIEELSDVYLNQPLERELELKLNSKEAGTMILGGDKWSYLGYDSWVFSGSEIKAETAVTFQLVH